MISMSLRSFKIQSYYILGILLLGWMLTPFRHIFRRWNWAYCKYVLRLAFRRRIEKLGDSIVKKTKAPTLGMFNRFAAAILGAIIMYEIEHHMVMWAFAVGIMGGYFLIVVNLGYYSMKDEKELTKS